jgi:hypothetical protein
MPTCHHGWVACLRAPLRAGVHLNTMRGWQSALRKRRDRRWANPNSTAVFLTSPRPDVRDPLRRGQLDQCVSIGRLKPACRPAGMAATISPSQRRRCRYTATVWSLRRSNREQRSRGDSKMCQENRVYVARGGLERCTVAASAEAHRLINRPKAETDRITVLHLSVRLIMCARAATAPAEVVSRSVESA